MQQELIQAQMHLEFLSGAWNELNHWHAIGKDEPSDERKKALKDEIASRTWAALYLVQFLRTGNKEENHDEVMRDANAHNGGVLSIEGAH